jgi:transcriptional regulator with GAF, ATPase, and Fis domain
VGEDPGLKKVLQALQRAAASDATVLLEGESGTGKELFARTLHALSPRADGPFVAINCAAIPDTLLESELFGHEKGAFTGAVARKPGRFELAHRGTLFLDEIGDLPLPLQAKILRAIEDRRIDRLGGTTSIQVDVRLVAATNRNLRASVAARRFREDLFFRLSVFPITIPPLRERRADVAILARYFAERYSRELRGAAPVAFSPEAVAAMETYDWPGNVRELQNAVERAVILSDGEAIRPRHLSLAPDRVAQERAVDPWDLIDLSGSLAEVMRRTATAIERRKIQQSLKAAAGDRAAAADILQISLKALLGKLKEHGLGE